MPECMCPCCGNRRDVTALLAEVDRLAADAARVDALAQSLAVPHEEWPASHALITERRHGIVLWRVEYGQWFLDLRAALDDLIERQKEDKPHGNPTL